MPKVVCVVQARTDSSRLPGKVLRDLMGRPMIFHIIERLKRAASLDAIMVATSDRQRDLLIAAIAQASGVGYFRGDEDDVLARYVGAAVQAGADIVVRITGDCPLIDPATVDAVVAHFQDHAYDYVGAGVASGFPRGLDTEVMTFGALAMANELAVDTPSREHVTYYLYNHPEMFSIGRFDAPAKLRYPQWRLCVDEEDDFRLVEEIYRHLYKPGEIIDIMSVVDLLVANPDLTRINEHVQQKAV